MRRNFAMLLTVLLISASIPSIPAYAADDCGFGLERDLGENDMDGTGNYTLPDGTKATLQQGFFDELYKLSDGSLVEYGQWGKCEVTTWNYDKKRDGFSNAISISMDPEEDEENNTGYSGVEIFCDKKRISIYVWVEYANAYGWSGSGQIKFDSASPKKFEYWLQKDFDGVVLKDSKNFMRNLVMAKERFSFKIPTVNGYEVLVYPKGNILKYRTTFAKAGCKF